jgi:hypothetical protein
VSCLQKKPQIINPIAWRIDKLGFLHLTQDLKKKKQKGKKSGKDAKYKCIKILRIFIKKKTSIKYAQRPQNPQVHLQCPPKGQKSP